MPGVGIDKIVDASAAFTVFPNPATDKITLQCSPDKVINKVELMDVQGKLMQVQSSGNSTEKQMDISMLPGGIYFIKITSGKDVVYKKVVKD
jgi:PIN domain nuclease of toxin-antitoxin system